MHLRGGLGQCEWIISPTCPSRGRFTAPGCVGREIQYGVFVQTASLSRPPDLFPSRPATFCLCIRESCRWVSSTRWGEEGKTGGPRRTRRNPQSATLGSPFAREPLTVVRALQQGGGGAGLILMREEEGA